MINNQASDLAMLLAPRDIPGTNPEDQQSAPYSSYQISHRGKTVAKVMIALLCQSWRQRRPNLTCIPRPWVP